MLPDEKLVFDHIANAGNTGEQTALPCSERLAAHHGLSLPGIWTKTLKARTNIHQTNINKYLKSLEGKNLVKSVKSVKHPTRKIYMLEELQPSIELSGGPWYTDNELDTEFIGYLLRGIRKCLQERVSPALLAKLDRPLKLCAQSFPSTETRGAPMYPTNHTPYLGTTVDQVLEYLAHLDLIQAGTELSTEHISSLLDVLIYDGEVERVMVAAAKDETMGGASGGQGSDSEDEARSTSRGKRRKGASPVTANKKRRIREASVDSDNIDGDEDGGGDEAQAAGLADGGPSDSDEVEGLAQSKTGPSSHRPRRAKPRPPTGQIFMYRSIRPGPDDSAAARITGIYDMPCGRCPQFTFCSEKGGPWQSRVKGDPPLARIGLAGIGAGFGAVGGLGSQGGVAPVNPVDCIYLCVDPSDI